MENNTNKIKEQAQVVQSDELLKELGLAIAAIESGDSVDEPVHLLMASTVRHANAEMRKLRRATQGLLQNAKDGEITTKDEALLKWFEEVTSPLAKVDALLGSAATMWELMQSFTDAA